MAELIDNQTASNYYNEIDTATGDDLQTKMSALESWANAKKTEQRRQEEEHVSKVFTDFDNYSAAEGLDAFDEESRYQYANRKFIANQTGDTPENQMFVYPSKRDEVTDKLFGKTGLSEAETFNLIRDSLTAKKETETALRELPGALAKGMFSKVAEGKTLDETDSWFLFQDWKNRHADKLGKLPEGWESAMLDRAVKLQARSETMMRDLAPESKRAFDTLLAFTRPEDAAALPEAGRADVENIAKEFAKLTPEDRQNIYSTLYYAAEADGAGMGKGFFEKVGEGIARGGVNIYNDAEMTAQDRQARQNISYFQSLLDKPEQQPDRMQTAESIQMQRDLAQKGVEENTQRLSELKALREIRQIADGTIDPIKTEMDGVMGSIVQGAYDFSQSAVYTGLAAVPYVGLPAVMGALTNSNYLRMLDTYPDMDADAALAISGAIAAPQAFIERLQGRALIGKSPMLNSLIKKMTDVRIPIAGRLAIGYGANVAYQTGQEFVQEAMPVAADQLAAAIREDMPEFDAEKAWGAYKDQMPDIFFSMLWAGLIGTGTSTFREFKRNGQFERSLGELEMVGITGEAAQDIAAEQDLDVANTKFREAWSNRTPEDIQAGIAKRAAQLEAASSQQDNPDLPVRRIEENADGTLTHIIEKPDGTVLYRTNDSDAADTAFVNITGMVGRSQLTGTTRGIVESLQFIDQVNQAAGRGEDVQKLLLDDAPRNLLDEYEANPTEQNLNTLFETVRHQGQDINEPAELANFPVLASNQGALVDGVFRSIIKIQDGATGDKVMRDFSQDNLKRAIAENRITMDWVRENLNQVIPLIESERNTGPALRTETDTDVIESFSDVAVAYMTGRIHEEQIPQGFRGFLRRMAIIVKDIFRRAYRLKRAIAEGKIDSNFESFLADSVGLNQQTMVDTTRERASGDIITDGGQMLMDFSIGSRTNAVSTDTPSIRASNATITGPANYSIGAFHGTPHKVDKFSTGKIGTGEGAQAYGWGLYFAEKKPVAQSYRRVGATQADIVLGNGNQVKMEDLPTPLQNALAANLEAPNPLANAKNFLTGFSGDYYRKNSFGDKAVDDSIAKLDEIIQAGGNVKNVGNLYTAELDVEPEDLLDWDKPFSEQSPKVKAALQSVSDNWLWQDAISGKGGEQVGGALYSTLRATFPDAEFSRDGVDASKKASEALLAAGIPGIRYLDGGSRSDGQGTYNYVAFDENLIKITEENGNRIPASQALAGPATGATNYSIGSMPVAKVVEVYERTPDPTLVKLGMDIDLFNGKREIRAKIQFANAFELEKVLEMTDGEDAVDLPEWVNAAIESAVPNFKSSGWGYLNSEDTTETTAMISVGEDVPVPDNIVPFFATTINDYPLKSPNINYSIASVEHFKNDKRFDKLVKDGRVVIGHDIEEFKGMHILLHSPDNAFAGTIKLTDGEEIEGKGGVYYPALYANKNYFWASTEATVMTTAKHLNEIGQKNGGKILMGLVSAPVEKLFSSTSMATGVVKFLNSLTSNPKAGLSKEDLNSMLVEASKVQFVKKGATPKKFSMTLAKGDGLEKNLSKVDALLEPTKSIFQVRKMFSESLADQLAKHLKTNPESSNYVAGILADAENKHAKSAIKRGTLSKASILQGLGNLFTEPFLRDFQDHGNGKIYAVLEVDGMVDGVASKAHDSYPFTLVPRNKKSKVKLHVLNQAVDWQDVVGRETGEYTTPEERIFLMPTSGMSAKTLKVLGVKGGSKANPLNYSIASQSEIDRVNRALGGMNRGPDARLAVYERAKSKLIGLMQSNQASLDDLKKGTVSFRRTQVLQALGELDAILSIFPPDLRGRVGGYTKLASIAPHDVFKDGEKVSEVSGMNGAIISAWMREGQNIGQAGQQTELPPGYTAKENLGTARADRAISDFFKKRIEMIDRELEKTLRREYDEAFRKLLDRTKPKKAAPGEKPKGIGGDIQDLFAVVRDSVDMNATQVAAHIAGLDSMIASGELTAEQEARAQIEAALVALTGDWKNADSDRRRTALTEATRIWSGAYAAHTQKVIRQREEREIARAESIIATGKDGDMPGRASKAISDSGLKGTWKDYILNLLNFDQVVGVLFGENSEFSNTIIDKQRLAENAKEDGSQTKMQGLEDFFSGLAGGNLLAGERLRYQLTQPSMTVNDIQMSQLEGLSAVMMWAQEDGRRHMEGERDENGRPSGKWNYDQAFVDEITTNLSAEALALRDWLSQQYAAEYANINAVYSELNGVNLPQIKNYSPVTVQPVNAPAGQVLDPVSGSAMSGASTSPGALRTRGTSIAEPRFQDALQTYIAHTLQMEHWKAFAPMLSEVNGILRNRDVQNSVQEKGGIEARKMLNSWLDYFGQGGNRDAGAHLALNQGLNNILGRASQVALVGRISTLLIQSTQLGAALAEVPAGPYLKRMGKLLSGQLSWDAALNSDYIQRRIKQMPPVVQMAMQGLKGAKPTAIQQAGKRLGMLLSGADGLFTAGTYAIVYDWHLSKAKELGLAGQQAEDYARNTAERATDRIAQPTRAGARSLYENTQTNPLARAGWAFASEARKNLALVAYSFAERDTATKLRTIAYVLALNAIGSQILRSIWRDTQDDDDEELFDEKYWNPKRFLMAAATEPLYGIPVFGSMLEEAVYKSAGEYNPQTSLFSVASAVGPIKRLPDHLSGDTEMRDVFSDIDKIISSLGIMHPNIAATASITHLAKDLFGLADSAVDATTED
jgi:hypothetical protein